MKHQFTFLLLMICFCQSFSQVKENEILMRNKNGHPKLIKFKETKISRDSKSVQAFLKKLYKVNENTTFITKSSSGSNEGFRVEKFQQYYKSFPLEFGIINIISRNNDLKAMNGDFIHFDNLNVTPQITESEALNLLLDHIGAQKYAWENEEKEKLIKKIKNSEEATYFPRGQLVIIDREITGSKSQATLAYKFDVFALEPLSRKNYYLDAKTGQILFSDAIIKHTEGIAATRYSGQRSIETLQQNGQFTLIDMTRGNGITTYNNYGGTNHINKDYVDYDNNWSSTEYNNSNKDNAGLDAHWGAMQTYDYFAQTHSRNSIDDNGYPLISYVNADLTGWGFSSSDNAFWDGNVMTYGMGTTYDPLVSLDIVAHEIGHGLDQNTSDLIYQRESGAINEGLSDIWGAMVEHFAAPEKSAYLLGEDIGIVMRSMENPKSKNDPDTYGGQFWINPDCETPGGTNDNCGVHTNSSILNYWFYLLAEGSAGTDEINDNGAAFSVNGIGKLKASQIIYRAQTFYFTPTTNYQDAKELTILAAEDLFGVNSSESLSTCQAWFAVGLGESNCNSSTKIMGDQNICDLSGSTYTLNPTSSSVSWSVTSNLRILTSNSTEITVEPASSQVNGKATITADIGGTTISRSVWIGKPKVNVQLESDTGSPELAIFYLKSSEGTLREQDVSFIHWEKMESNPCSFRAYDNETSGKSQCPGNDWSYQAKVEVQNSCGTTIVYFTVTPPPEEPCSNPVLFDGQNIIIPPTDCDTTITEAVETIMIYDFTGEKVLSTEGSNKIDLSSLSNGIYIMKAIMSTGNILTKKILK